MLVGYDSGGGRWPGASTSRLAATLLRRDRLRIRQVKPEFWSDAKLRGLPLSARLIYIGLWLEADDAGWLRWDVEQIAIDLLRDLDPSEAEATITESGLLLSARQRLRIFKCRHALIPHLPEHQRLAGGTRRVYTYRDEHFACTAKRRPKSPTPPRVPAGPRLVRLGQVRLENARARENGVGSTEEAMSTIEDHDRERLSPRPVAEQAAEWYAFWTQPGATDDNRASAEKQLARIGYRIDEGLLVKVNG